MRAPSGLHFTQLGRDQLEDYAHRTGEPLTDHEKWLSPYLDYDPS